ncbi:ABC transporter permease [Paenibacillus yanchengensis]|uniref:ABC transporter permease n=1 Tax=Paenibacillus yanchengensis TaxID=2035833 RepID=A0ABW4YIB1_9BACL
MKVLTNFWNLLKNENMKIYRRPRTYIMLAIIAGLVLLISLLWFSFDKQSTSMWEVAQLEMTIVNVLVAIFAVVIAASIVSEEFSTGTIKLLLIRPWSRSKILLSKYIAAILFLILATAVLITSSLLINWLLFSVFSPNTVPLIDPEFSAIINDGSSSAYLFKSYGLNLITTIVTVTMSFMISTIFRSNILAISISLFMLLIVNNMMMLLTLINKPWVDYLLFIHLDLVSYLHNSPIREGLTLSFSLTVLACYWLLFMILTWVFFKKRDVAS